MKKILIYSILLFALCSCDNFLEEDPRGKLTPSSFFSSPEDLDMAKVALSTTKDVQDAIFLPIQNGSCSRYY